MLLGNALGSNMFNIGLVGGLPEFWAQSVHTLRILG